MHLTHGNTRAVQLTLRSSDYAQIFGAKATKAMGLTAWLVLPSLHMVVVVIMRNQQKKPPDSWQYMGYRSLHIPDNAQ